MANKRFLLIQLDAKRLKFILRQLKERDSSLIYSLISK